MDMLDYLQRKVFKYCNDKKGRGVNISIYDIYMEFKKEWWDLSAVLYGSWLQKTSSIKTEELSEQEWE